MNWEDAFRQEFGIHFEGCAGELGWAIDFIEEEIKKAEDKIKKEHSDYMYEYHKFP